MTAIQKTLAAHPYADHPSDIREMVRELSIPRTPFTLVYRVMPSQIEILRLWDSRQGAEYWRGSRPAGAPDVWTYDSVVSFTASGSAGYEQDLNARQFQARLRSPVRIAGNPLTIPETPPTINRG